MRSKELSSRFGETNIVFAMAVRFYTTRIKEPEKSALLADKSNFDELILEIETKEPIGVFRKKNFFFGLSEENLKEAEESLWNDEISNWYIRKIIDKDLQRDLRYDQLISQTV